MFKKKKIIFPHLHNLTTKWILANLKTDPCFWLGEDKKKSLEKKQRNWGIQKSGIELKIRTGSKNGVPNLNLRRRDLSSNEKSRRFHRFFFRISSFSRSHSARNRSLPRSFTSIQFSHTLSSHLLGFSLETSLPLS